MTRSPTLVMMMWTMLARSLSSPGRVITPPVVGSIWKGKAKPVMDVVMVSLPGSRDGHRGAVDRRRHARLHLDVVGRDGDGAAVSALQGDARGGVEGDAAVARRQRDGVVHDDHGGHGRLRAELEGDVRAVGRRHHGDAAGVEGDRVLV